MKAFDAILGLIVLVGLTGAVLSNPLATEGIVNTVVDGTGYLTQVAQLRTPSTQIRYQ